MGKWDFTRVRLAGYLDSGYRLAIWSAGYLAGQRFTVYGRLYSVRFSQLYENLPEWYFHSMILHIPALIPNIPKWNRCWLPQILLLTTTTLWYWTVQYIFDVFIITDINTLQVQEDHVISTILLIFLTHPVYVFYIQLPCGC